MSCIIAFSTRYVQEGHRGFSTRGDIASQPSGVGGTWPPAYCIQPSSVIVGRPYCGMTLWSPAGTTWRRARYYKVGDPPV